MKRRVWMVAALLLSACSEITPDWDPRVETFEEQIGSAFPVGLVLEYEGEANGQPATVRREVVRRSERGLVFADEITRGGETSRGRNAIALRTLEWPLEDDRTRTSLEDTVLETKLDRLRCRRYDAPPFGNEEPVGDTRIQWYSLDWPGTLVREEWRLDGKVVQFAQLRARRSP